MSTEPLHIEEHANWRDWLERDPGAQTRCLDPFRDNLLLGVLERLRADPKAGADTDRWVCAWRGDRVVAVVFYKPPFAATFCSMELGPAKALCESMKRRLGSVQAVHAPQGLHGLLPTVLGSDWSVQAYEFMVCFDRPPVSGAQLADKKLLPTLTRWFQDWAREQRFAFVRGLPSRGELETWLAQDRVWVACAPGGTPGAFAVRSREVGAGGCVGYVYTVPSERGQGLGGVATAAATAQILDHGQDYAFLYVNARNTAALTMYRRQGFVTRSRMWSWAQPRPGQATG